MATERLRPIAWFEVLGTDGDRLRSFYARLFGLRRVDVTPEISSGGLRAGPHTAGPIDPLDGGEGHGHVTVFVEVEHLEETLRKAETLGGKTITGPMTFLDKRSSAKGTRTVTFAYFADPEGHVIGLCRGFVRPSR